MTERIERPFRAWAEYDLWSVYLEFEDGKLGFRRYVIPKGEAGRLTESFDVFPGVAAALKGDGPKSGSLESVRVLYENGYRLKLQCYANINGLDTGKRHWHWYLVGVDAAGDFAEDSDSEAVERAMIAAAAFFSQRQD